MAMTNADKMVVLLSTYDKLNGELDTYLVELKKFEEEHEVLKGYMQDLKRQVRGYKRRLHTLHNRIVKKLDEAEDWEAEQTNLIDALDEFEMVSDRAMKALNVGLDEYLERVQKYEPNQETMTQDWNSVVTKVKADIEKDSVIRDATVTMAAEIGLAEPLQKDVRQLKNRLAKVNDGTDATTKRTKRTLVNELQAFYNRLDKDYVLDNNTKNAFQEAQNGNVDAFNALRRSLIKYDLPEDVISPIERKYRDNVGVNDKDLRLRYVQEFADNGQRHLKTAIRKANVAYQEKYNVKDIQDTVELLQSELEYGHVDLEDWTDSKASGLKEFSPVNVLLEQSEEAIEIIADANGIVSAEMRVSVLGKRIEAINEDRLTLVDNAEVSREHLLSTLDLRSIRFSNDVNDETKAAIVDFKQVIEQINEAGYDLDTHGLETYEGTNPKPDAEALHQHIHTALSKINRFADQSYTSAHRQDEMNGYLSDLMSALRVHATAEGFTERVIDFKAGLSGFKAYNRTHWHRDNGLGDRPHLNSKDWYDPDKIK